MGLLVVRFRTHYSCNKKLTQFQLQYIICFSLRKNLGQIVIKIGIQIKSKQNDNSHYDGHRTIVSVNLILILFESRITTKNKMEPTIITKPTCC